MIRIRDVVLVWWIATGLGYVRLTSASRVRIVTYSESNCQGEVLKNVSYVEGMCQKGETNETSTSSIEYKCHQVVRPTCAYLRYNCSGGYENGRTLEMPCEICSVSNLFFHPLYYNYSCNENDQIVRYNTQCSDNCTDCNKTLESKVGECVGGDDKSPFWELISVGPCKRRALTLTYPDANCTGLMKITGEVYSGGCDLTTNERMYCEDGEG